MHLNRRLRIDAPVSRVWRDNAAKLSAVWSSWWNYKPASLDVTLRSDSELRAPGTALAFSGGVDSLFALLAGPRPDLLVAVHGFDIPLADEYRMLAFASSVEAVAAETGTHWTIVRTNLREHHSSGRRWLWERAHGGGIAAVGHLLANHIGTLGIAASYSENNQHRWGSTIGTDPLFSSDRVEIEHDGADHHRERKIHFLASSSVAHRHLRVCWENLSKSGNCSRCGKCLATMLLLAELGALDDFEVFTNTESLPAALDALPYLKNQINIVDRLVNRATLPPRVNDAARRLVVRSRKAEKRRKLAERLQRRTPSNV